MTSKILTAHYTIDGIPQTGLSPTINIYELSAVNPNTNPQVVSNGACVEIGQGWYRYDFSTYDQSKNYVFTFDGGVALSSYERYKHGGNDSYTEDITASVLDEPVVNHTITGSVSDTISKTKADTTSIVLNEITLTTLINLVLKYSKNKTKIDVPNAQLIIYDDDQITPLTTFNLKDANGMPSVLEVCQRVPV